MTNLLETISPAHLGRFAWDHAPDRWEPMPGGGLRVLAPGRTDYFRDPGGKPACHSAPFLWLAVEGDFVARARVRPAFGATWDAGCLMVRHTAGCWAKLCYEKTDFGTRAIVSVVTDGISDDANGVDLDAPQVWLQAARAGDLFALHYAPDGLDWRMVRYFRLPVPSRLQVGLVAQCPAGAGTAVEFLHFSVEPRTVADLRAGR